MTSWPTGSSTETTSCDDVTVVAVALSALSVLFVWLSNLQLESDEVTEIYLDCGTIDDGVDLDQAVGEQGVHGGEEGGVGTLEGEGGGLSPSPESLSHLSEV